MPCGEGLLNGFTESQKCNSSDNHILGSYPVLQLLFALNVTLTCLYYTIHKFEMIYARNKVINLALNYLFQHKIQF